MTESVDSSMNNDTLFTCQNTSTQNYFRCEIGTLYMEELIMYMFAGI